MLGLLCYQTIEDESIKEELHGKSPLQHGLLHQVDEVVSVGDGLPGLHTHQSFLSTVFEGHWLEAVQLSHIHNMRPVALDIVIKEQLCDYSQ